MWQNLIVALAFVATAAWVTWKLVLPRTVCNHMRRCLGGSAACGDCCGADKAKPLA